MSDSDILKRMVDQATQVPAPTVSLSFEAELTGVGHYSLYECKPRIEPPSYFSFMTDNGDEIIIWSARPGMNRDKAHEIAIRIGEKRGLYV